MKKSRIILAASAGILAIASAFATKSSTRPNPMGYVYSTSLEECVTIEANCPSGSSVAYTTSNCEEATGARIIYTAAGANGSTCSGHPLLVNYN